jgi:signal transduction histidine kinase
MIEEDRRHTSRPEGGGIGLPPSCVPDISMARPTERQRAERHEVALAPLDEAQTDRPPRILIVDDDRVLLEALPGVVQTRMTGVIVETIASAQEALTRIEQVDYDAIVSDIKMPDVDGLSLLSRIRELQPATPTLLITGHGEHDLAVLALRGGAFDFLQKPIDREYFIASLRRAIRVRQLSRQVEAQKQALARHANELERIVQERTRELHRANQAKDEFLATLSHELRTPLTAIFGWAQMLQSGKLDEATMQRALDSIERNARVQVELIDDLLDISRIITGKLRLQVRPLDLASVVEAATDAVQPAAEAKGIRLEHRVESKAGLVSGDPDRLQQVVWNVLSNAIKFTSKGGRVTVALERVDSSIEVSVTDTGQGIDPEFLPYVFDRFRQADSTTTRRYGGLGLGLAIVRHLVEMHGGTAEAESAGAGCGSVFRMRFPLVGIRPSESVNDQLAGKATRQGPATLHGVEILVVEDEPETRELLVTVLVQSGASVKAAASAPAALEALKHWRPDVLISDIGMPEEDGYELIRKIRALEPESTSRIPAVALTAYARAEDRMRALSAGFQIYVPKPVEPAELTAVVASLAGKDRQARMPPDQP